MNKTLQSIARSWCITNSFENSTDDLLAWVKERNQTVEVEIYKNRLEDSGFWFYDWEGGCIRNQNRSFFTIMGYQQTCPDGKTISQPIILQEEIGYLGILCREFGGVMHFLMQA